MLMQLLLWLRISLQLLRMSFTVSVHRGLVVCRDLKPENILLTSKGPEGVLKVIDFGTSEFCKPGQRLSQKFGTPYYVAPEVCLVRHHVYQNLWQLCRKSSRAYHLEYDNCDTFLYQAFRQSSMFVDSLAVVQQELVCTSLSASRRSRLM
jgi:serine/threonine protein kinase